MFSVNKLWIIFIVLLTINFFAVIYCQESSDSFVFGEDDFNDVYSSDTSVDEQEDLIVETDGRATSVYFCNFTSLLGTPNNQSVLCFWDFGAASTLFFKPPFLLGSGRDAFFLGGPSVDGLQDPKGGYAFFDVGATRFNLPNNRSAWLVSESFDATGPEGYCLGFQYDLEGLGIDSLRIRILYNVKFNGTFGGALGISGINGIQSYEHTLLWEQNDTTSGKWAQGHLSFASQGPFMLVYEAVPSIVLDKYEGYAAIDNTVITGGSCPGGCIFDANFCSWKNVNDSHADEFDWELGRGTMSTVTGPLRDRLSTVSKMLPGGYAYINSAYPRRPGDRAILLGPAYPASVVREQPLCLVFWFSAYGPKMGDLVVSIVPDPNANCTNCTSSVIWKLRPEKLVGLPDLWLMAQAILVSPFNFRVQIEATVGETGESDIAIDDISIQPGVCPAMPSMASPPGDCTFDDDMCGYYVKSIRQAPYSPPLWERVKGGLFPGYPLGHTGVPPYKIDYFMKFDTNNYQHAPLDRSWLISPVLTADGQTSRFCLTFWIDMFAMVPDKNGLGALEVLIVNANTTNDANPSYQTVWRLNNNQSPKWLFAQVPFTINNATQIAFDGIEGLRTFGTIGVDDIAIFPIYGNAICHVSPARAEIRTGDCYFDTGNLCGWSAGGSTPDAPTWTLASSWNAPNFINDHTFGAPRIGFVFYTAAGESVKQQAVLESPEIQRPENVTGLCFSFWYLVTGSDPDAVLTIADRTNGALGASDLLRIRHGDFENQVATSPQWHFGQVTVGQNVNTFRVYIYANGKTGTFALDDITITPVSTPCAKRPE